jgi:hypothetical protein
VLAFQRCIATPVFKAWHKLEVARRSGMLDAAERSVDDAMRETNIRTEVKSESGKWEERAPKDMLPE